MTAITTQTYEIPSWLNEHCFPELNSTYDWMNRPLRYQGANDDWVMATDGKGYVALKLPVSIYPTRAAYLAVPNTHTDTFKELIEFDREGHPTIDTPRFKAALTEMTQSCKLCNNVRVVECSACEGSTEVTCSSCAGKGSFPCITCRKPDHCKVCDGEGVVECKRCDEGKAACGCTTDNSSYFVARLVLNETKAHFNLYLLKKLLARIDTKCQIKIENSNKITLWDKHQIIGLMGIHPEHVSVYPELLLDGFLC